MNSVAEGGLVVAPSGTCFARFIEDEEYRRAILAADLVLPDSGLMVVLWRLRKQRKLSRISGLAYLKRLISQEDLLAAGRTIWVLPHERAREKLLAWVARQDRTLGEENSYVAPIYRAIVEDEALLRLLDERQPANVVIGIGAGAQEKLGNYLRDRLSYRSSIHCIGGALGFLTGDQAAIPAWADRLYLGWFLRLSRNPRVFVPRLWKGRSLPWLIWRYGKELPPLQNQGTAV